MPIDPALAGTCLKEYLVTLWQ